ncbi:MAG: FAD-dependent thymidylate synthase [Atribacterota bacterium]|jgi:thymidylate synthase (FAD)|nr:FAD-dependent thymidylate synthase [Atribacterota bacterium]MDD4895514.1 FAD-dependent thymidylate synthase [Atribacterota bacterium]MDD5636334.1 FAD-dependent thymidylate synthase [Atribacterota bacterium]
MKVQILNYTRFPEETVAQAARLCYSNKTIDQLKEETAEEKNDIIIKKIMKLGHYSVLEHVSFTFGIEDISRITSHQLVRHRIASFSQKSQRYVKLGKKQNHITPKSIRNNNSDLLLKFQELSQSCFSFYREMLAQGIPAEDARYILPQSVTTSIIFTANARELIHFFRLRCCNRAQWEIRELAISMLKLVKEIAPHIFQDSGPSCLIGPCPEGEMTCGKPWSREQSGNN